MIDEHNEYTSIMIDENALEKDQVVLTYFSAGKCQEAGRTAIDNIRKDFPNAKGMTSLFYYSFISFHVEKTLL